jgi:hypothetical protein
MYNEDTDVLFPPRVIPYLQDLRGEEWQALVSRIKVLDVLEVDRIAFVLLMIRVGGCASCHSDAFRAMRGCTLCATQTIKRFRGVDEDLLRMFDEAKDDVIRFLNGTYYSER